MKSHEILDLLDSISDKSEQLIEFLFLFYKSSYKSDHNFEKLIINYLHELNFDDLTIKQKCSSYNNIFENYQDNTYNKALNSTYLRYFIKDLNRRFKFTGKSQNQVKKLLAARFVEIIYYMCISNFKNFYKKNYFNLLMEVLEDEQLLANEFKQCIEKEIVPFIINKDLISDNRYDQLGILCNRYVGAYLIEYNKDNCDQEVLEEYKSQLQKLIQTDLDEIDVIFETVKDEQVLPIPKQEPAKNNCDLNDDFIDDYNIIDEAGIFTKDNYHDEISKNDLESLINELNDEKKDLIDPKLILNLTKKARKIYEKYFQYSEDDYENEYEINMMPIIMSDYLDKMMHKETQFINNIGRYFEEETLFYYDEFDINDEYQKTLVSFEYSITFLNILAYSLQYGTTQVTTDIVSQFKEILDSDEACRKNFSDLLGDFYQQIRIKTTFPPTTLYRNQIIIAVLLEIDNIAIAKKVKKILINDTQVFPLSKPTNKNLLNDVLVEFNKKHARLYFNEDNDELFNHLHEFAVIYLLSYFKDKAYIAANTAFVRFAKDEIAYCDKDFLLDPSDYNDALTNNHNVFNTKKEFNDLKKAAKQIDQIINTVDLHPDFYRFFQPYNLVMLSKNKDNQFYNDLSDLKSLFINYRDELIYIIYNHYNKSLSFSEMALDQQVEYLVQCCVNLSLINEIDRSEELLINIAGVENTTIRNSLEKEINELKLQLTAKDQLIKTLENSNDHIKANTNEIITKEVSKISATYQNEISALKKQLKVKDEQIEILQENQSELYKLRELLFTLQETKSNDSDIPTIDLSKVIKNKNIVLVGGHIKLIERLKDKYPAFKFMGNDRPINEDIIAKADYVFIFYNFFNHSDYRKVMSAVANKKVQWDYLNTTNLERVENFIFEKIV